MIYKAFKYRIYPTKEQEILISKHIGSSRFIFNWALAKKIEVYQKENKSISRFDLQKELPTMKKSDDFSWLKEVNSQSLQASLENLDKAYTKFFRDKKGFPKFKAKHRSRKSFSIPQSTKVDFKCSRMFVPKFKGGIKVKFHREFQGVIKTSTISQNASGKYFVSILVETDDIEIKKSKPNIKNAIGLDLGIKTFAVLSDGTEIQSPKHLKNNLERLKVLQKRASKKQKGSSNRRKANKRVALLHERITNRRSDFLHKTTIKLIRENQTICLETLKVSNMIKNHNLAQAISDVSWSKFNEMINYKSDWYGVNILRIGQFEPSSKMCSCGVINKELKLSDRVWTCKSCNTTHDRDLLASQNILRFAFHPKNNIKTGAVRSEESVEMPTLAGSVKQEAHLSLFSVGG